jgi:hypothetical protein
MEAIDVECEAPTTDRLLCASFEVSFFAFRRSSITCRERVPFREGGYHITKMLVAVTLILSTSHQTDSYFGYFGA